MKLNIANPEILLAKMIDGFLAEEDPDTQLMALVICLVRFKLYRMDGLQPAGRDALERLCAAISDPDFKREVERRANDPKRQRS